MSELPEGWGKCRLGDVLMLINGRAYKQQEMLAEGTPLLRIQNLNGGENWYYSNLNLPEDKYCNKGDLLYAWSATFGPYWWNGDRAIYHYHIWKVIPSEFIDKNFAYYELWRITDDIKRAAHGVAMPHITKGSMENWEIVLPPLAEQKRIADKLDRLLARVDNCRARLDRVPAILKRFRQAVLAAATSGALTVDWREEDTTSGWDWDRAEDVCEKVQSGGTPKEGFVESEGIPFLKVYNIVDQKINFFYKPQFVTVNVHNGPLAKSRAKPGDVLMNIVGPPLGKVAIVPHDFPEWNINQAITLFRPSNRVTTEWLYYFLCSGISVASVEHQTRGSAGQSNISLSQCRDFTFPVPPLEEQHEIVRRVETLFGYADRLEARYRAAAVRVERLTPALLAKAFRGELVAQDPADEPAAQLLARLQTARTEINVANRKTPQKSTVDMKITSKNTPTHPISVVQALHDAGKELSSEELLIAAGYPSDADAELIEDFLVAIREAVDTHKVTKVRRNNKDWFSVAK